MNIRFSQEMAFRILDEDKQEHLGTLFRTDRYPAYRWWADDMLASNLELDDDREWDSRDAAFKAVQDAAERVHVNEEEARVIDEAYAAHENPYA